MKQVSSLSSGASLDKPIPSTTRSDSVEDPIESEANSSALVAGTTEGTEGGNGGQWVVVEEAANPDLDEIVIKQELDANGMSDFWKV